MGEEVADTLAELVGPPEHEPATRSDVRQVEARLDGVEARLDAMDERWDQRMEAMEHRLMAAFERRISDAVTTQTRTLVLSQLGALVVIAALAFGLR